MFKKAEWGRGEGRRRGGEETNTHGTQHTHYNETYKYGERNQFRGYRRPLPGNEVISLESKKWPGMFSRMVSECFPESPGGLPESPGGLPASSGALPGSARERDLKMLPRKASRKASRDVFPRKTSFREGLPKDVSQHICFREPRLHSITHETKHVSDKKQDVRKSIEEAFEVVWPARLFQKPTSKSSSFLFPLFPPFARLY